MKSEKSSEIHGNQIECFDKGNVGECVWRMKNREGTMDDMFILRSEKLPTGLFKDTIEFTDQGMNLIEGTELEENVKGRTLEI
jgi:hypothetical protein